MSTVENKKVPTYGKYVFVAPADKSTHAWSAYKRGDHSRFRETWSYTYKYKREVQEKKRKRARSMKDRGGGGGAAFFIIPT